MIQSNNINILIYSKFSQACRKFMDLLDASFVDPSNILCIDNKKTRERIVYSDKLNIREVPCIARVNQLTGFTELFEGDKAFLLLQNHFNMLQNSQPPQMISNPQPPQNMQNLQNVSQSPNVNVSSVSNVSSVNNVTKQNPKISKVTPVTPVIEDEEDLSVSQLPPQPKPKQDSVKKMQQTINNLSSLEEIADLENDIIDSGDRSDKENAVNTYMHVPKNVKFDIDSENSQRLAPERTIKSGSGGGSTISKALQMQKEREQESSVGVGGYRS